MSDTATKPVHTTQRIHSFFCEFDSETFQDSVWECEEIFSQWLISLGEHEISQECDEVVTGITCCLESYATHLFMYLHGTRVILREPDESEARKILMQRLHDRGLDVDIHSLHDEFIVQAHTKAEYAISLLGTALTFDIFNVPQHYEILIAHLNELVTDATSNQNEEARAAYLSSIHGFHSFIHRLATDKKLEVKDARIQCLETENHGLIGIAEYLIDQFREIQSKQNSKPRDPNHPGHTVHGNAVMWKGMSEKMTHDERLFIAACQKKIVEEGDDYITVSEILERAELNSKGSNPYMSQVFRKDNHRKYFKLRDLFFEKQREEKGLYRYIPAINS